MTIGRFRRVKNQLYLVAKLKGSGIEEGYRETGLSSLPFAKGVETGGS